MFLLNIRHLMGRVIKSKTTLLALVIAVVVLVTPNLVFAAQGLIFSLMNWILYFLSAILSTLIDLVIRVMLYVSKYNNFLDVPAVDVGWKIIRDLCNNFFIVILMVSAISTVLSIKKYHYKAILSKLLMMAILINFSKMFTGLLIDFSQVIMLTFADKIATVGGKNILLNSIGLNDGYNLRELDEESGVGALDVGLALMLVMIVGTVAIVVITMITIILVYRIVMFWFLVIMSPFAYLASTFPPTQAYASKWWSNLFKYLAVGPAMMFFLYLSFFTMNKMAKTGQEEKFSLDSGGGSATTQKDKDRIAALTRKGITFSTLAEPENLFSVLITIAMMAGSLIVAQDLGVKGSKWGAKGISMLQDGMKGKGLAGTPFRVARTASRAAGTIAGTPFRALGRGVEMIGEGVGGKWGKAIKGAGTVVAAPGRIIHARVADSKSAENKARTATVKDFMKKKLGFGKNSIEAGQAFMKTGVGKGTVDAIAGGALGYAKTSTLTGAAVGAALGAGGSRLGKAIKDYGTSQRTKGNNAWGVTAEKFGGLVGGFLPSKPIASAFSEETNDQQAGEIKADNLTKKGQSSDPNFEGELMKGRWTDKGKSGIYFSGDSASSGQKHNLRAQLANKDAQKEQLDSINGVGYYAANGAGKDASLKAAWYDAISPQTGSPEKEAVVKKAVAELQKSLAAAEGNSDFDQGELLKTKAAIDFQADDLGISTKKTDDYKSTVIKSRNVNKEGRKMHEDTQEGLNVKHKFAEGEENTVGLDFREIKDIMDEHGVAFDIDQQGLNISEQSEDVIEAIKVRLQEIATKQLEDVEQKIAGGTNVQANGNVKNRILKAQARFNNPDDVKSLALQNRGLIQGKREKSVGLIHEDMHQAGLQSDEKAEEFGYEIEKRGLRSLTKDIGQEAAQMEADGEEYDFEQVLEKVREKRGSVGRIDEAIEALKAEKVTAGTAGSAVKSQSGSGGGELDTAAVLDALEKIEENTKRTAGRQAIGKGSGSSDQLADVGPGSVRSLFAEMNRSLKNKKSGGTATRVAGLVGNATDNRLDVKVTAEAVRGAIKSAGEKNS
jgi:hypothetical protein